jgi:hypothetical protein
MILFMEKLKLAVPWQEVKEKLKEANLDLTDEDLVYEPGQDEALVNRLAKKMNRDPEHIKGWIESVSSTTHRAS